MGAIFILRRHEELPIGDMGVDVFFPLTDLLRD